MTLRQVTYRVWKVTSIIKFLDLQTPFTDFQTVNERCPLEENIQKILQCNYNIAAETIQAQYMVY